MQEIYENNKNLKNGKTREALLDAGKSQIKIDPDRFTSINDLLIDTNPNKQPDSDIEFGDD